MTDWVDEILTRKSTAQDDGFFELVILRGEAT